MNILKHFILFVAFAALVGCATAYDKRGVYHRVSGNESIWKIAKYYHVSVQDLAEWNNIQDAKEILAGLKLYIPSSKKEARLKFKELPHVKQKVDYDAPIKFERSRFSWPVVGSLSSPFGIRDGRRHDGIDIRAKKGTHIKAADKGKVVFSDSLKGYGKMLILEHKDQFYTVYAHNSKNMVKKGQKVAKGQLIGYVGSTGRATGPHLHFEVRKGQKARNPLFLLPAKVGSNVEVAKVDKSGPKSNNIKIERKKEAEKVWSKRKAMMENLKKK